MSSDPGSKGGSGKWRAMVWLMALLGLFCALQAFVPLRTAIQIGGDEGFELAKATQLLHGHKLYSEVWNDQPPLHTFLITAILKHGPHSALGPRLVTSACSIILLAAVYVVALRTAGLWVAVLTTAMIIASPGFLELSSSCMLEIPSLALALLGLGALVVLGRQRGYRGAILTGVCFGLALSVKLIILVWTPLIALAVCLQESETRERPDEQASSGRTVILRRLFCVALRRNCIGRLLVFSVTMILVFIGLDLATDGGAYLTHFGQSWRSHFGSVQSFEYGSPAEHGFDWGVLLRNWDITILACIGVVSCVKAVGSRAVFWLPLTWLAVAMVTFTNHKPWWNYYYIHMAVPLCWCAAIGASSLWAWLKRQRLKWQAKTDKQSMRMLRKLRIGMALGGVYALLMVGWMGARWYLQIVGIRQSPRTFTSLSLAEAERYKPFTRWLFTDECVYSFYLDIPLPPSLAVMPLKRFWSGDMSNARIVAELNQCQPELILLRNRASIMPFQDMLTEEYRLVYEDPQVRLYASRKVIALAKGR